MASFVDDLFIKGNNLDNWKTEKKVRCIDYLKDKLWKNGKFNTKYVKKYTKDSIEDCKSMATSIEIGMELLTSAYTKLMGTSFKWETDSYAVGIVSLSRSVGW